MASDPYIQREDDRAWEDEQDYRQQARDRMDRAREKASLAPRAPLSAVPDPEPFPVDQRTRTAPHGRTTIESMEGTIAAGLEYHEGAAWSAGPPPPPPPGPLEPPRLPERRYVCAPWWQQVLGLLGWLILLAGALVFALGMAVTIIEVVAWFMDAS